MAGHRLLLHLPEILSAAITLEGTLPCIMMDNLELVRLDEGPGDPFQSSIIQRGQRQAASLADWGACGKPVPVMQPAERHKGWASQHPGLPVVRRRRQPLTRSPRNLSSRCSPREVEVQEMAAASGSKRDNKIAPFLPPWRAVKSPPRPATGSTTLCCKAPGCAVRPSYGFRKQGDEVGGRWWHTLAAEGMKVARRFYKKPTHCHKHFLPEMTYLLGGMCNGGHEICAKRPSYGFWEDLRPSRCSSHKEREMEDLISARCNFAGCRTVASFGAQVPGSHVIRRTRCKAHATAEMTCATKGPPCRAPGGCKTRPSYGWPDKLDDEHCPRPERCKMHLLPAMEYMGSTARAKKKRQLETVKQPAPVTERPPHPDTHQPSAKPFYLGSKRTPWLHHPTCKCTAAAALILEPDLGDIQEMDATEDPPEAATRASFPKGCMCRRPKADCTLLAVAKSSRLTEERVTERWSMQREELEKLGNKRVLQEQEEVGDWADDQMGLFIRSRSPELAGMSEFDKDFSSSWGRWDSPEIEAMLRMANDTLDSV